MRAIGLAAGAAMTILGAWAFWTAIRMIYEDVMLIDWSLWMLLLIGGSLAVSFGPAVMIAAHISHIRKSQLALSGVISTQTYTLPQRCPNCGHGISIHHLDWIGPAEARCPYCSVSVPISRSTS